MMPVPKTRFDSTHGAATYISQYCMAKWEKAKSRGHLESPTSVHTRECNSIYSRTNKLAAVMT